MKSEAKVVDLRKPEGREQERPMTVNERLEASGVIHISARCTVYSTSNTCELPVTLKGEEVEVHFTCVRCSANGIFSGVATPIVYRS